MIQMPEWLQPKYREPAPELSDKEVARRSKQGMKKVNNGRKWTDTDLTELIALWCAHKPLDAIAKRFNTSEFAVRKMVTKMRANGIPIPMRAAGNRHGRTGRPWSQEEIEYLVRRRGERETAESIAAALGRSFQAVQNMISTLRREGVNVPMLGQGVRRRWSAESINMAIAGRGVLNSWEFEGRVPDDILIGDTV